MITILLAPGTQMYDGNQAHNSWWWAAALTALAFAVIGMMLLFLVMANRAYDSPRLPATSAPAPGSAGLEPDAAAPAPRVPAAEGERVGAS